jgi:hypothetical protein
MGRKTACTALWQTKKRFRYKPVSKEWGDQRYFFYQTTPSVKLGVQSFRSLEYAVRKGIFVYRIDFKIL